MKKLAAIMMVAVFPVLSAVQAQAGEGSQIDKALTSAMSELSTSQIEMNLGDESHRQIRDGDVEKNERIEVDPNDVNMSISSADH